MVLSDDPEQIDRPDALTVQEIKAFARAIVERETLHAPHWVTGTVRKSYLSDRGHHYFELSDGEYTIQCMIRSHVRGTLPFTPGNDMELAVRGKLRVYERFARVELEIETAHLVQRPPHIIDETVLDQLTRQGLWPPKKRTLPKVVSTIALVTSKNSAAINDFKSVYHEEGGRAVVNV